jgi:hypothetical protein
MRKLLQKEGKTITLLYPQPRAFITGKNAHIKYATFPLGQIDKTEFYNSFVLGRYGTKASSFSDNLAIPADGVIILGGATYSTNSAPATPEVQPQTSTSVFNNL